jgi:hypothetical protein
MAKAVIIDEAKSHLSSFSWLLAIGYDTSDCFGLC